MIVLMIGITMAVMVRVAGSVRVLVFVLVEDDLQAAPEGIGDAAQGGEARDMVAPLQAGDHRLRHADPRRELFLRFPRMGAQLEQAAGA